MPRARTEGIRARPWPCRSVGCGRRARRRGPVVVADNLPEGFPREVRRGCPGVRQQRVGVEWRGEVGGSHFDATALG